MVKRYAERAGINKNVTPHTLRHTFATNFIRQNGNVMNLKKILGHASLRTTEIYCYMDSTDVKEGLEAYYSKRDSTKDKNLEGRIKSLGKQIQSLKAGI